MKTAARLLLVAALACGVFALRVWGTESGPDADEFVGPFPSWANVKAEYGAVGDGKADDTAAIQKALESVRRGDSPKRVLYFPAGTYRLTATLRLDRVSHHEPLGMSIIGENPLDTVLQWDGPAGGSMLLYDAWYACLSRLTFDGRKKAKTAIRHGPAFATANECSDVIIKDVEFGIEAGQRDGIAETAVLRCRFLRCSRAAISIQNFNSLDWYIWDSWFEDCGLGVTNEFGAGNFHVYRSVFLRSTDADISIRHTGYFSFVGNISLGSKTFFQARRASNWKETETWGSQATLQDNLVLDPQGSTPIVIENNGPNMLVDNTIRARGDEMIVRNEPPADRADLICIGNTWTAEKALQVKGRVTELDNRVVKAGDIRDVKVEPVPFPVRADRPIIEVAPGADAAAIQAALDRAAGMKGRRPVVHLPKGNYAVSKTLLVPAGADLQLVGDGPENATQLNLTGGADPLIRVQGPSHATFRTFLARAGNDAVAIQVEDADQAGARVFGEQLNASGNEYGFVAEGMRNAWVELRDAGHNGLEVIGDGPGTGTWVALFCGASSRGKPQKEGIHLYDIRNGGRLLVRDIWYEGGAWSLMDLKGSGEFAYHCGFVAPYPGFDENAVKGLTDWEAELRQAVTPLEFDGFRGRVCFSLVSSNGADLRVRPPSPDLKLYLLGFYTNRRIDLGGPEVKGAVVGEHIRVARRDSTGGDSVDGTGKSTPEFIREMLEPLRRVKPRPPTARKDDVTDIRFHRVWANGKNGIRLQGGTPPESRQTSPAIQPICGVPGYKLQVGYRFGKSADVLPGETPVTSTADMVKLGWKHDEPWGRINNQLQYYVDFRKPETYLGPNHVFEADHLALVARHDDSPNYGSVDGKPDMAYSHIASGEFITSLTVEPPVIVEFMVMVPGGRGMWPACWLYDEHSGKHDASEIDVMEMWYNAPIGQGTDFSMVFQFDHGPGAGKTLADPGGLDSHGGMWQPYGSLKKGDPGSDLSKRWVAFSLWWEKDRASKYVDDKLGITRAFKWTGPSWPNILVGNACGGSAGTGPILPETFKGDNSTFRIKWIRVFKPSEKTPEGVQGK